MKKKPFEYKASTRDYLRVLSCFPNYIKLLDTKDKPYIELVDWVLKQEAHLKDDSLELPTIKQLALELDIPATKLTMYLPEIYKEIVNLNWDKPNLFKTEGQKSCCLLFKYFDKYFDFYTGLDSIPRVGEYFHFLFTEPQFGLSSFHVNKVHHNLEHGGHTVTISLGSQMPNSYLTLLKEKAYLNREITLWDYLETEIGDELEEKLIKYNRNL